MKEVKRLSSAFGTNGTALPLHGKSGNPYGDKTILAERNTERGIIRYLQDELPVTPDVNELVLRWLTEGDTAQGKRTCVIGKLLLPVLTLLSDHCNGFKMAEPELRNTEG